MGINNKERRREKKLKRQARQNQARESQARESWGSSEQRAGSGARHGPGNPRPGWDSPPWSQGREGSGRGREDAGWQGSSHHYYRVTALITEAMHAIEDGRERGSTGRDGRSGPGPAGDRLAGIVELLAGENERLVHTTISQLIEAELSHAWAHGWLPADIERHARRELGSTHARLVVAAVLAATARYDRSTLHPLWRSQLASFEAPSSGADGRQRRLVEPTDVRPWVMRSSPRRPEALRVALELLYIMSDLHVLARICPAPGEPLAGPGRQDAEDNRALERVRALLAKAESTTFPEEAEALSAKAQELMAKYSIDRAAAAGAAGPHSCDEVPEAVRLAVDDPYAMAKALLLQHVAKANRCESVWDKGFGYATVFGYLDDLNSVEMLYTSLLVQADSAMVSYGKRSSPEARKPGFRKSFLIGYASRIGSRLEEIKSGAEAAAGSSLLPVLRNRDKAVKEACEQAIPTTTGIPFSVTDRAGWIAGNAAAELAQLSTATEVEAGVGA